ncbi:thiamine diphosphokinase [Paenibacillaceae bacterium]|nr:thiamine diphosphokinase [Paenibacillaceae bacterium]
MAANTIVITTGGSLGHWAIPIIKNCDYLIGADQGALFLVEQGYEPDLAIGDFDSVTELQFAQIAAVSRQTERCDAIDKNYTDTELAFRHALAIKPKQLIMLGALGTRFDHSLANVHLLRLALQAGVDAVIIDEHNSIRAVDRELTLEPAAYPNVSLLPLTLEVTGITLKGFAYPLEDAAITLGQSLGISNRLEAAQGVILVKTGIVLVIQSRD